MLSCIYCSCWIGISSFSMSEPDEIHYFDFRIVACVLAFGCKDLMNQLGSCFWRYRYGIELLSPSTVSLYQVCHLDALRNTA